MRSQTVFEEPLSSVHIWVYKLHFIRCKCFIFEEKNLFAQIVLSDNIDARWNSEKKHEKIIIIK